MLIIWYWKGCLSHYLTWYLICYIHPPCVSELQPLVWVKSFQLHSDVVVQTKKAILPLHRIPPEKRHRIGESVNQHDLHPSWGTPKWMVYNWDDLGVPLFSETSIFNWWISNLRSKQNSSKMPNITPKKQLPWYGIPIASAMFLLNLSYAGSVASPWCLLIRSSVHAARVSWPTKVMAG